MLRPELSLFSWWMTPPESLRAEKGFMNLTMSYSLVPKRESVWNGEGFLFSVQAGNFYSHTIKSHTRCTIYAKGSKGRTAQSTGTAFKPNNLKNTTHTLQMHHQKDYFTHYSDISLPSEQFFLDNTQQITAITHHWRISQLSREILTGAAEHYSDGTSSVSML